MSSFPTQPVPPSQPPRGSRGAPPPDRGAPVLRLITVGRTGLEQALRRESDVELVRVPSPLEAVGELGEPLDSIERAGVLVSQEAFSLDESLPFLAALRLIDPAAPVLLVADANSPHAAAAEQWVVGGESGFDGIVPPDASMDAVRASLVRRVLSEPSIAEAAAPPAAPDSPTSNQPADRPPLVVAAPSPQSAVPERGDASLVYALLTGRELLIPAMDLIRARVGTPLVHFAPAVSDQPPPTDGVPVTHRGKAFGYLRSPAACAPADSLAPWAAWLASWLALADQQTALRQAAMLDDLTGAYNRRYFDRYLGAALQQARTNRHTLTLLVFDIDDFKFFNDRFGHPAGDDILRETVRLLRSVIRPGDRVCRIGGDEFAVVFYEPQGPRDPSSKPPESVESIAHRFQSQIREHRFPKLADHAPGPLTISGGLATYPWDGRSVEELLERADQLALESKRAGKNAITLGPAPTM